MSLKRASVKCRLSYILLAVLAGVILLAVCAVGELREHLGEITEYKGKQAATEIITAAVEKTVCRSCDSELYSMMTDESGNVISVSLDTAKANRMKNLLTGEIEKSIEELGDEGINIPLGTLLGIPLFTGKGSSLELGIQQLGAVRSDFSSKLESAGINQTRLTVYVTVTVEIRAILPNGHKDITVSEEQIINDSLIVGDIPQYYRVN